MTTEYKNLPDPADNNDYAEELYEEISEKNTSKLGYAMLILMVVLVITAGEAIFSDIKKAVERPIPPSLYILRNINTLETIKYVNFGNRFNKIDKKFRLDTEYNSIKAKIREIATLNQKIYTNNSEREKAEISTEKLNEEYDLALNENITEGEKIFDKISIKSNISIQKVKVNRIKRIVNSLTKEKEYIYNSIKPQLEKLTKSHKDALDYYNNKMVWYHFKAFLLTLAIVVPFFALSFYIYLKLKKRDSSNTIIFSAVTVAFAILLSQVIIVLLYNVFPKVWITGIYKSIVTIPLLHYIIYYGSVAFIIMLFGGIVFYIQKKAFDPVMIAIRRLKNNKCPKCSFTLESHNNFCPKCGLKIREKCNNCGSLRIKYLFHCSNCGSIETGEYT